MPKIHVVDRYTNEILEYEKETDIEFKKAFIGRAEYVWYRGCPGGL